MRAFLSRLGERHQLAALRHRGFRRLWTAALFSSTARWADMVVIGWLTLEMTESAMMVGVVSACRMAGYIAAPFMGVVADRVDRRRLVLGASLVNCAVALVMLTLLLAGALTLSWVIGLALLSSVTWALDNPTRQALVPDLVSRASLANAIALNSVATEITVVAGPALGGILIPLFGLKASYALIAGMYCMDLTMLYRIGAVPRAAARVQEPPLQSLMGGLRYVWRHHSVLMLLLIAFFLNLFCAPYRYTFLPLFARYVLDAGAAGYGMLTSVAGAGALCAAVCLVSQGDIKHKGRGVLLGGVVWGASLLLFALSRWYYLSLALVFVAGFMQAITWTLIATLILSNTAQSMRGRVMGLRTGVVVSLPFGNFLAGAAAERFGAPLAMGAYAACAIGLMLAIVLIVPRLRGLE